MDNNKTKIITFSGVSGSAKTTIAGELIKNLEYELFVSITTRDPRPTDLPGEYEYLSEEAFAKLKEQGAFAWDLSFTGASYAAKQVYLDQALTAPHSSIMILVPDRVVTLYEKVALEFITSFYIQKPSQEILRSRLEGRGDPQDKIEARFLAEANWDKDASYSGIPYISITNNGTIEEVVKKVRQHLK